MTHDGTERRTTPLTDEQLRLIGEETARASRRVLRQYVRRATAAFLAVIVGLSFAGYAYLETLKDGLENSCARVQIVRAQSNVSDSVSWTVLTAQATAADSERFRGEADKLTITALTDCKAAVDNPGDYKFPVASPIGDTETGQMYGDSAQIISASEALLAAVDSDG